MLLSVCLVSVLHLLASATADENAKIRSQLMQDSKLDRKGKATPKLDDDEIKDRLREMMGMFDADGDERISRDELRTWIVKADRVIPQRVVKEQFQLTDENEDGFITWGEHLKSTFDVEDPDDIMGSLDGNYDQRRRTFNKIQEDEEIFKTADKNGDNRLDEEEFPSLSIPEYDSEMTKILLKHAIGDRDLNNDGKLTFEEYMAPSDSYHADNDPGRAKMMFERVIDADKNGVLDRFELKRYYIPNTLEAALQEEEHLMEEVDEDGDDHLSFEEVLQLPHIFMKSDITSYGHHINEFHNVRDEL